VRATDADLAARYRADGWWTDDTLGALLDRSLRANATLELRVWSATRPFRAPIGVVHRAARQFASRLQVQHGVEPGDVVAFQLPNCPEAAVVFWGAAFAGAVLVPIVHFYGPREVGFIVEQSQPKVIITADVLAGAPLTSATLASPDGVELDPVACDPDQPALIAYTSGTTADPKGVIHTHRSLVAEIRQLSSIQPPGDRAMLAGAPVGHAIGMLTGLLLPVYRHKPIHLIDVWNPAMILDAMLEANLTAGSGATYFLTSLLDAPGFGPEHAEHMGHIGLGGSSVPEAVADRAIALGISVSRSYGSTEHPSITGAAHTLDQNRRKATDGLPLAGVELEIVDDEGTALPAGAPGEIRSRGPELFAGYTDPALTAASFDADGWYRTGDIGRIDGDGWLTITDRKSDIIIRGGENISAVEVESLLLRLPGVAEVAVVAAPDARLGEHACAFFRMVGPGTDAPSLETVRAHLRTEGLAKQKWPEEIRTADDLPRTPTGKVKKHELRDLLRNQPD
jgi:acyl-CoA synthetase